MNACETQTLQAQETRIRRDVAACYRLVAHYGWDDLVATHISARLPGEPNCFLINPFGTLFEEITASSLVKVDMAGEVTAPTSRRINPSGFVIHSADYHRPETVEIDGRVAMTSSREILRDIASQHGPEKMLVAFGYAGWAGGQLEGELAQRAWFTATADSKLIFDLDRDKVWGEAMAHHTQDL